MIILGTNSIKDTGYDVANSCRFNAGSSDRLIRTQTAGNRRTYTISWWMKRSGLTAGTQVIGSDPDGSAGNNFAILDLKNTDALDFSGYESGHTFRLITNRLFRDVSAWMHIVFAVDTTQGTAANRMKIYVNGVQETSFSTENYPSQNYETKFNENSNKITVGGRSGSYFNGYMAEVCMIDGQSLAPTSFGEFDEDSGIWKPIDVSGLTFGTNGFYLDFENSGALGADVSGESNNFTVNNLTAIDQTTDTPTNNFATLNSLAKGSSVTLSNGNLTNTTSGSTATAVVSTIGVSQGKWFIEAVARDSTDDNSNIGVSTVGDVSGISYLGVNTTSWCYTTSGLIYNNASSILDTGTTHTFNDVIGMAVDMDNGQVFFYKNGTIINSGSACITGLSGDVFLGSGAGASIVDFNFGNAPYTISSGNTDGNGYGNFEYAVPSGYYALNTKNLAEYG